MPSPRSLGLLSRSLQQIGRARWELAIVWLLVLFAWNRAAEGQVNFADATAGSGLDFVHEDGADREGYLVSLTGSGLGLFDYDNDGRIDVYFLNGIPLAPEDQTPPQGNGLFRNLGRSPPAEGAPAGMRFSDATAPSHTGLGATYCLGTAMADFDNDGFQDIAVSNFGSVSPLHNNGDGTFTDLTARAGLGDAGIAFGAGIAWLDIENDGNLDLYVADYVDFQMAGFQQVAARTFPYPPGPDHFPPRPDRIFRSGGDGSFVDHSQAAGIADLASPSMGVVCGDFDSDGDTDVFVCSDAQPNLYYINDGRGVFSQEAELLAVAYNSRGIPMGSMGVDAGDIDNDGAEDLFITDYSAQMPILFRNLGEFGFEDISTISRSGRDVVPHVNWGAGIVDFDNDGDRDLMIANGHLFKWAHEVEQLTAFKVGNTLLANDGRGRFTNITESAGPGMAIVESSRGIAFDDLDNDGDLDCVVLNSDARANLLENRLIDDGSTNSADPANWVQFQLIGDMFNRGGVGAKVTVETGGLSQIAEARSGRGYQSHYGARLAFGLGSHARIERVVVDWLGEQTEFLDLEANQIHLLRQSVR